MGHMGHKRTHTPRRMLKKTFGTKLGPNVHRTFETIWPFEGPRGGGGVRGCSWAPPMAGSAVQGPSSERRDWLPALLITWSAQHVPIYSGAGGHRAAPTWP